MQAHYRVPVNVIYKQFMLLTCFALMVIEYESNILFLWPLDHSCARPANLSRFSETFVDSKSQPIDLDAVQRNLFDATPEDPLTLARAISMGISYDDVAQCFEYPADYQNGTEPILDMNRLEPCRFGLRFEIMSPNLSIIDHFNLACSRQWLKVLVTQSFSLGLLAGFILVYCAWLPQSGKRIDKMRNLTTWTGSNLTIFSLLYVMTLVLNQCYFANRNRRMAAINANDTSHQEQRYFVFLACIFMRSLLVSSIACRLLTMWKATSTNSLPVSWPNSIREQHFYFVSFAITLVTMKIIYMPLTLRLFDNWSSLNRFLTLTKLLSLGLASLIEFLHTREQFHRLVVGSSPLSDHDTQVYDQSWSGLPASSSAGHHHQQQQQLVESQRQGIAKCGYELVREGERHSRQTPLEIDEMRSPMGQLPNCGQYWARQRYEPASKFCEFCSFKEERIFGRKNQHRGHMFPSAPFVVGEGWKVNGIIGEQMSKISNRQLYEDQGGSNNNKDESSPATISDESLDAYRPTTSPLDHDVTELGKSTIKSANALMSNQTKSSDLVTLNRPQSAVESGQASDGFMGGGDDDGSLSVKKTTKTNKTASTRRPGAKFVKQLGDGPSTSPVVPMIEHNLSLIELNLMRWPLMSKLFLLTFCLTFNYFLIQTIPNHKLMHAETISSVMERKANHRNVELSGSVAAPASDGRNKATNNNKTIESEMTPVIVAGGSTSTTGGNESILFVYDPKLSSKSAPQTIQLQARRNTTNLNSTIDVETKQATDVYLSIKRLAKGSKYEIVADSASRDKQRQQQQQLGDHNGAGNGTRNHQSINVTTTSDNQTTRPKQLQLTIFREIRPTTITMTANSSSSANKSQVVTGKSRDIVEGHAKYKYDLEPDATASVANNSVAKSSLEDLFGPKSGRLFNYNSVDYATLTIDRLARSLNPFELAWITMNLNGWPVELLIILLYATNWTNFESTYFKLNRLFSLVINGSKVLVLEWLLIALIPKQNHLLEMEWLLASLLIVARFSTSLMLYSHLHMLFKLSARLGSNKLIETIRMIPIVLLALALALWAPIFEKINLVVIPLILVASNSSIYYLARNIDDKFKALLCPMMFD